MLRFSLRETAVTAAGIESSQTETHVEESGNATSFPPRRPLPLPRLPRGAGEDLFSPLRLSPGESGSEIDREETAPPRALKHSSRRNRRGHELWDRAPPS